MWYHADNCYLSLLMNLTVRRLLSINISKKETSYTIEIKKS